MLQPSLDTARSSLLLAGIGLGRRKPGTNDWLLREVDVSMNAGERVAIVGPSGSGKTLLLRALARLDPLDAGEVRWQGQPVVGDVVPDFRRRVIYVHQRPAMIEDTVEANLRLPFELRSNGDRHFDRSRVVANLQLLGRDQTFLQKSTRDLSGGELQITALLRAIQLDPQVLLLDEPTAALDTATVEQCERLVAGWFEGDRAARALIWVSHDSAQAARVAGRRWTMREGRITKDE